MSTVARETKLDRAIKAAARAVKAIETSPMGDGSKAELAAIRSLDRAHSVASLGDFRSPEAYERVRAVGATMEAARAARDAFREAEYRSQLAAIPRTVLTEEQRESRCQALRIRYVPNRY